MLCPKCGSYVMDGAPSCSVCGAVISNGPQPPQNGYQNGYQQNGYQQNGFQNGYQQNGYQQNGYQQNGYQSGYQQNGFQNGYQQNGFQNGYQPGGFRPGPNRAYQANMPMAWYKFLIYFALWVGGIFTILSSFAYFAGASFLGILQGLCCLLAGAFFIFTRYRLAEYRQDGPLCLYICYASTAVINLAFSLLWSIIYRFSFSLFSNLTSLVVAAVYIALNYVYFSKRAHLFRG